MDRRDATHLYRDGADFVFMDSGTTSSTRRRRWWATGRLPARGHAGPDRVQRGGPLYLELPVTVELVVSHTEPGLRGDRSSAGTKPATLETGAEIQVPLFINIGDKLKVDSRDGSYLGARQCLTAWWAS